MNQVQLSGRLYHNPRTMQKDGVLYQCAWLLYGLENKILIIAPGSMGDQLNAAAEGLKILISGRLISTPTRLGIICEKLQNHTSRGG
jgi:hypothetical protein